MGVLRYRIGGMLSRSFFIDRARIIVSVYGGLLEYWLDRALNRIKYLFLIFIW